MSTDILVAEDDPDIQLIVRLALKKAGLVVAVVSNGRRLFDQVAQARPDVILLDWMMPEMDGPTACAALKADPATAGIRVVFTTAKSQEREIARGLVLGAIGYIVKPFDALTLGEHVKALLATA